MNGFLVLPVLLLAPAVMLAQQPLRVGTLSVSEPATITKLNTGDLRGQPHKLAWSDDGRALYLPTLDGPRTPNAKMRHYLVSTDDGRRTEVSEEPAWAKARWAAKSDRSSPDKPSFVIMDVAGQTQALDFTKDASLPAFSPDGRRLAWLRKDGRKSFKLQISQID